MVVQYYDGFAEAKQIRALRDGGFIDIHHHQNRIAARHINGLLAGNDHILVIFRVVLKQFYQRLYRSSSLIQYNVSLSAEGLGDPVNTHRRTEAVHIRHPVSHDNDTILAGDDFPQGMSFYSCLDTGILLYLLALAAVVGNALRRLDDRLVTAASQRQINGGTGKLVVLRICQSIQTDTDTDGHRHLVADVHRLDLFQQIKTVLLQLCHCFFPHDYQILVLLQLLADTIQCRNVFIYLTVDQSNQQGSADFLDALQGFLVVVQIDHAYGQALVIHFLQCDMQCRLIEEIHSNQVTVIAFRIDHIAVFRHLLQRNLAEFGHILTALVFQFILCLVHTRFVRKPVPGNGRKQGSDGFTVALGLMHHILKSNVGPDHLAGIVQKGVWQFQIPQQFSLDLTIFRGKADQLVHDDRLVVEIQRQGNCKIKNRKSEGKQSCTEIQHEYRRIDSQQ